MRILFLSSWFPYPADNGSKIRIFNLIKQLSNHHEVDLLSFTSEPVDNLRLAEMRTYCHMVKVLDKPVFNPGRRRAIMAFFSRKPRSVVDTYSPNMQRLVWRAGQEQKFDLVIASQLGTAIYTHSIPGVSKLIEEVELSTLYEQYITQHQPIKKLRHGLMWWKWVNYTNELVRESNGCTVVSEKERQKLLHISHGTKNWKDSRPIKVIPNGVDMKFYNSDYGQPEPYTLSYVGALTYNANFDAAQYFLKKIYPLIKANCPEVRFSITGKLDRVPLHRLPAAQGVSFTGYLDDIRPVLARSWVSVVPLRIGGGTRLKILESLALGTPVVSTRKGAEGLDLVDGRDILIADDPGSFAECVIRLLKNPELREKLGQNGRKAVAAHYDWNRIGSAFRDFVDVVAKRRLQ